MTTERGSGTLMKMAVIIAAAIIVIRIVLEQLGASQIVNNIFGVAWMYLIMPILFGLRITARNEARPFRALVKDVFLFALYTRLMVMVTYMLAYRYNWNASRFSASAGGNVGGDTSPLMGYLVIPARNAVIWIVFAILIGIILGGITVWLKRKSSPPAAAV